jgi:hypothetical protein
MRMPLHARLYNWLSPADDPGQSDLIFVLAGRQSRKLYALELFRQALGGTLLMSVGRFEIRRFAQLPLPADVDLLRIASTTQPRLRHYFVRFQNGIAEAERVPRGRFGTLSEIQALAQWLEARPRIGTLLVVSTGPHLRRVRACCRAILPARLQVSFIAAPESGDVNPTWLDRKWRALVLKEIPKLFIYRLVLSARALCRR